MISRRVSATVSAISLSPRQPRDLYTSSAYCQRHRRSLPPRGLRSRAQRTEANEHVGRAGGRAGGRSLPAKLRPRPLGLPPFAQGETADRLERRAPERRPRGAPEGHCGVGPWRSGVTGLRAPKIWRDYNDHSAPGERAAAECYAGAVGRVAGELV